MAECSGVQGGLSRESIEAMDNIALAFIIWQFENPQVEAVIELYERIEWLMRDQKGVTSYPTMEA